MTVRSNPAPTVPTPPRTNSNSIKTPSPTSTCPMCQKQSSSRSTSIGRRPKMEGDDMKLPLFHGNRTDDPEHYWFLCEEVWTVRQATDDDVKKGKLVNTLRGHTLDWFMKFIQVPQGALVKTLDEIQMVLIKEFRKPKSKAQYITELKDSK